MVLDRDLDVRQTYIGGDPLWNTDLALTVYVPEVDMRLRNRPARRGDHCWLGCEVNLNTEGLSARDVKTFKVTGEAEVVLETFDGAIEVHSWDRNEIEVEVEKRAMEQSLIDEIKVDAQQQGDKITIKVTGPSRPEFRGVTIGMHISPTARLRVAVPRDINLNATSGDGSIRVEAIDGRLVLNTTDGSVTGTRLGGDIQIRSGDGSIRLDHVTGKLDLETDDGSIGSTRSRPCCVRDRRRFDSRHHRARHRDGRQLGPHDQRRQRHRDAAGQFNAELDAETSDGAVRATHPLLGRASRSRDGEGDSERRERRRILRSKIGDGGKIFAFAPAMGPSASSIESAPVDILIGKVG